MFRLTKNQKLTCLLCGRDKFTHKSSHYCIGGYRKKRIKWGLKTKLGVWKQKTLIKVVRAVSSGDYCKCGVCNNEGYVYGIVHSKGASHPFCQKCGANSKLTVIKNQNK